MGIKGVGIVVLKTLKCELSVCRERERERIEEENSQNPLYAEIDHNSFNHELGLALNLGKTLKHESNSLCLRTRTLWGI